MARERTAFRDSVDVRVGVFRDQSLRRYFANVFLLMSAGLAMTGVVAGWIAQDATTMSGFFHLTEVEKNGKMTTEISAGGWWIAALVSQIALVIYLTAAGMTSRLRMATGSALFILYATLVGMTIAPVVYAYTTASAAKAFFITAGTFAACATWGHTTKMNLTRFGGFFLFALIGLLIALVVNVYLRSPTMDFVVSGAAVLLFAALTAYDMQDMEQRFNEDGNTAGLVVLGALTFYLDFVNMFIYVLKLMGFPMFGYGSSSDD